MAPTTFLPTVRERPKAGAVLAEIEQLGRKGALLQIDVADVASFGSFAESLRKTLREELGRETLDFLINNAGIDSAAPFAETTEENFDRLFS
jgi:NAD(P)-dependent dehydrogenase (short-subunit alcohol dehydrogenase family)